MSVISRVALLVTALLIMSVMAGASSTHDLHRTISFRPLSLRPTERIVAIEITLTCGRFVAVNRIPNDWLVQVEGPIGNCRLMAQSGHGGSALRSTHDLDRFATLVIWDQSCFQITATISTSSDFQHVTKHRLLASDLLLRNA